MMIIFFKNKSLLSVYVKEWEVYIAFKFSTLGNNKSLFSQMILIAVNKKTYSFVF